MSGHRAHVGGMVAAFLLALGGCSGPAPSASGPDTRTNVVLLVIDTLRADRLGAYGSLVRTPWLDRLARRGAEIRTARSQIPITGPSHASMFTARYPVDHGVHNNAQQLDDRFPTLAERMRASGRATAAVVSLGVLQGRFGFARGFDEYFDDFAARDWWRTAQEVNADVLPWLRARDVRPFFLWVHYSDPHSPYASSESELPEVELRGAAGGPSAFPVDGRLRTFPLELSAGRNEVVIAARQPGDRRFVLRDLRVTPSAASVAAPAGWETGDTVWGARSTGALPARIELRSPDGGPAAVSFRLTESMSDEEVRARYAEEVESVDRQVGVLVRELESLGLADRTLIVVASDHGEGLGDHGETGHVDQLYESQLRVPFLLDLPGRIRPALVSGRTARLVDVMPTVLDLLRLPPETGVRGRSLAPLLRGEVLARRPSIAFTFRPEATADLVAVTDGDVKYLRDVTAGTEALYRLAEDPGERSDRAGELPEDVRRFRDEIAREGSGNARPVTAVLSEEERDRLRGLGYVH